MGVIWGIMIVLAALLACVTLFDLVKRHLRAGVTAAWVLAIVLLPFAGSLLYWGLRRAPSDEIQRRMDTEREIRRGAPPPRIGS